MNEYQYKRQIFFQVSNALEKYSEEYPIQNPEKAINALENQFGMGFDCNFRAIVKNYIERGEYSKVKNLCDCYAKKFGEESDESKTVNRVRGDINKAEIGEIILRAIRTNATEEEQKNFFNVLEGKLKSHRYNYSSIPLGKSKDGKRKITLADIWEDERALNR